MCECVLSSWIPLSLILVSELTIQRKLFLLVWLMIFVLEPFCMHMLETATVYIEFFFVPVVLPFAQNNFIAFTVFHSFRLNWTEHFTKVVCSMRNVARYREEKKKTIIISAQMFSMITCSTSNILRKIQKQLCRDSLASK